MKPRLYSSPISLPEGRIGGVRIEHRILTADSTVPIVGMRQALLRGIDPVNTKIESPLRVHALISDEDGVWMTDMPEELNQIAELMHTIYPMGRVLIGGLGLGVLATLCARSGMVDQVTVVERDPDVIRLCKRDGYDVVQADIAEFLRTEAAPFDYYLLDTWQGTNEGVWWEEVVPLRRIIRQRHGRTPIIHCWAEDIMLGQIVRSLITKEPHWHYEGLPVPMSLRAAKRFVREIGLPVWEKRFGAIVNKNLRHEQSSRDALLDKLVKKMEERDEKKAQVS